MLPFNSERSFYSFYKYHILYEVYKYTWQRSSIQMLAISYLSFKGYWPSWFLINCRLFSPLAYRLSSLQCIPDCIINYSHASRVHLVAVNSNCLHFSHCKSYLVLYILPNYIPYSRELQVLCFCRSASISNKSNFLLVQI